MSLESGSIRMLLESPHVQNVPEFYVKVTNLESEMRITPSRMFQCQNTARSRFIVREGELELLLRLDFQHVGRHDSSLLLISPAMAGM